VATQQNRPHEVVISLQFDGRVGQGADDPVDVKNLGLDRTGKGGGNIRAEYARLHATTRLT
jgi:hypothetical protein